MSKAPNQNGQRDKILKKAANLIWKKGYAGTSMRDVAAACKMKASNLYNYFHSKEALLHEALLEEHEEVLELLRPIIADNQLSPPERLYRFVVQHTTVGLGMRRKGNMAFDYEFRNLSPLHKKEIIALRDEYDKMLSGIILQGIDGGCFAEIDVKLATVWIASMILRSRLWFSPRGRLSASQYADRLARFSLNGLGYNGSEITI